MTYPCSATLKGGPTDLLGDPHLARDLIFGKDVARGLADITLDDALEAKIRRDLEALAKLSAALKKGSLGGTKVRWLKERGLRASTEAEGTQNDRQKRRRRTWDWGNGEQHVFFLHTKPSDCTAPDRCARIYFEWCPHRRKVVVGWIGRHPD